MDPNWIAGIDTFIFDCDGVLWRGSHLIPGAKKTLAYLRVLGKKILFVTNNATKSRRAYLEKFKELDLEAHLNEVFGSAYAAAYYMKHALKFPTDKKVYVIGMEGMTEELDEQGIAYVGAMADNENIPDMESMTSIVPDPSIGAVLMGFDLNINYKKLAKAYTYLTSNPDCLFLATNDDASFPAGPRLYPGCGSLQAPLITAMLGRRPKVIGKPHQSMLDVVVNQHHLVRERTCMIGDRLDTDVQFGINGGLKTILVLSGVTTQEIADKSHIKPDFILNSIVDLKRPVPS